MNSKGPARMAWAVLLGAALAFPVGFLLGGRDSHREVKAAKLLPAADRRQIYSPKVLSDPYFLNQQRRNVEALEDVCQRTGQSCREAQEARHWLEKVSVKG